MNENMNATVVENEVEEAVVEQKKESKIKETAKKAGGMIKAHGKTILKGVGIGAVAVIGYALGKRSMMDDDFDMIEDADYIEIDDVTVEVSEVEAE